MADNYDARGQLWRVSMVHPIYAYQAEVMHARVAVSTASCRAPTWPTA